MPVFRLIAALYVAFLVGCAAQGSPDASTSDQDTESTPDVARQADARTPQSTASDAAAIIKQRPRADYATVDRCLKTSDYDSVKVLSHDYLVFSERGGKNWVNRIQEGCRGLRPKVVLNFAVLKGQICAGGMFEGLSQVFPGSLDSVTSHCYLGAFQEASEDQVEALKAFVRSQR
jgi:hypothetical protein